MTREEVEYFDIHYASKWYLNDPDMEIEADEMHENVKIQRNFRENEEK